MISITMLEVSDVNASSCYSFINNNHEISLLIADLELFMSVKLSLVNCIKQRCSNIFYVLSNEMSSVVGGGGRYSLVDGIYGDAQRFKGAFSSLLVYRLVGFPF